MMDLEAQVKKGKDDVLQLKKQVVTMTEQIDKETNDHEDSGRWTRSTHPLNTYPCTYSPNHHLVPHPNTYSSIHP